MQPNALTDGNKKVPKFRINSCRIRNRIQGHEKYLLSKYPVLWIWIRSDPKILAGSGAGKKHSWSGQLRIRNEFETKLL